MKTRLFSLFLTICMMVPLLGSLSVNAAADESGIYTSVIEDGVVGQEAPETPDAAIENPFKDVPANSWYTDAALYCYKYGYMSGTADEVFAPTGKFTRAMFVTILYQIDMAVDYYSWSSFDDVKPGKWYSNAVEWAFQNSYSGGIGDGKFGPDVVVTREQLASFLYTYSKVKGYDVSNQDALEQYTDTENIASWAKTATSWAVAEGLLTGTTAATLAPKGEVTRAQVAVVLKNYLAKYGLKWDDGYVAQKRTCTVDGVTVFTTLDGEHSRTVTYKAWHNFGTGDVTKEATCANDGVRTYYCLNCGTLKEETIRATGKHTWNSGKVTKAATCAEDGVMTYTCTVCNTTKTSKIAKTGAHKWDSGKITKQRSCWSDGVKTYTCTVCKKTKTEAIPMIGKHSWDSGKITKERSCWSDGVKTYTCTVCKKTRTETIPMIGKHSWDSGKVTKKATCAAKGEMTYTCSVCKKTRTTEIAKLTSHTWNSGKITKAATCEKDGTKTYTCKVCGTTKKETIKKLSSTGKHTWDKGKITTQPTCKESGVKTYTCSVCKGIYTKKIDPVDHKYVNHKCKWCGKYEKGYDPVIGKWYLYRVYNSVNGSVTNVSGSDRNILRLVFYKDGSADYILNNTTYSGTYSYIEEEDGVRYYYAYIDGEIIGIFSYEKVGDSVMIAFADGSGGLDDYFYILTR